MAAKPHWFCLVFALVLLRFRIGFTSFSIGKFLSSALLHKNPLPMRASGGDGRTAVSVAISLVIIDIDIGQTSIKLYVAAQTFLKART